MSSEKVSQRIGKFMKQKNISVEELASRTGLSQDFIERITGENAYPSLGPLLKIARALGVRLGTFLDDHVSQDPLIIRLAERVDELSMHSSMDQPVSSRFYSLGRGKSDRHMEPFFVEMDPESEKPLSSHEGEEFIVVHSGELRLIYGQENHVLKPGDSIYYNSVVPHWVGCAGAEKTTIYAVLYFPE